MRRRQSKAAPVSGLIVYTYAKLCVLIIISDIISMIELRHLRCFLGIARERTITRAAEALHISQPALSRTLQELEEDLGQQLIVRGKPLTLTAKGELLRQRAESMLDYFENFKQEISSEADELTGTITIAAGESPSVELLAAAFFKLKERWPRIRFALKSGNEFDVTTALNSGLADFGILIASPKAAEYYHLILPQRDPWVLWVPEEHALAQKERIEPQDFADLPVVLSAQSLHNNEFAGWLGPFKEKLLPAGYYSMPYHAYIFARQGRLPLLTLADLICPARADHYKALPLYPVLDAQLHLVWTSAVYASPLCRAFVQQVKMELTCGLQSQ